MIVWVFALLGRIAHLGLSRLLKLHQAQDAWKDYYNQEKHS